MADIISLDSTIPTVPAALAREPHELRCECRECGAHARVFVAYGVRTGHCSVCGSARLDEVLAGSGMFSRRRFRRAS